MNPARLAPLLALTIWAHPASAEKLDIDHRLHAGLHAAMDQGGDDALFYDASGGRVFDRILIKGTSAERDWTEALELTTWTRKSGPADPAAWYGAFPAASETACPATSKILAQDVRSLTFALDAPACPTGAAFTGLYRVFFGKRTIYLAAGKLKGKMAPAERSEWLALLAAAHISN